MNFFHYPRSLKSPIFFLTKNSLKNVLCPNARNCLVWCCYRTLFNPTETCAGSSITNISLVTVSFLVNSCKCVMSWHSRSRDITANCHVAQMKLTSIHTLTESKKTTIQLEAMCFHMCVHQNIKVCIYVSDETTWILLLAQWDKIQVIFNTRNRHYFRL